MAIIRSVPTENFTIVRNSIIEDARLSMEARGLLVYLLSRPGNWTAEPEHLAGVCNCGRDRVYRMLKELTLIGYIKCVQDKNDDGTWGRRDYLVADAPLPEKPYAEKPLAEKAEALIRTEDTSYPETRTERNNGAYAFAGKVIRLTLKDFNAWKVAFPAINLYAELTSLDDWYARKGGKDWFIRAARSLGKKNDEAVAATKADAYDPINGGGDGELVL